MTAKKFPEERRAFLSVGLFVCSQGGNKVEGLLMPLVVNKDKYLSIVEIAGVEKALPASLWEEAEQMLSGLQADFSKTSSCTPNPRGFAPCSSRRAGYCLMFPGETSLLVPQMSRASLNPPPLTPPQPQYFGENCSFSLNFALWLPLNYLFPFCLPLRA